MDTLYNTDLEDIAPEELLGSLVDRVLNDEHSAPEPINTYKAYVGAKYVCGSLRAVIRAFRVGANTYYGAYLKALKNGIDDFQKLYTSVLFTDCATFFTEELTTVRSEIKNCEQWSNTLTRAELSKWYDDYDRRVIDRDRDAGY